MNLNVPELYLKILLVISFPAILFVMLTRSIWMLPMLLAAHLGTLELFIICGLWAEYRTNRPLFIDRTHCFATGVILLVLIALQVFLCCHRFFG